MSPAEMKFDDISAEAWREYRWPDGAVVRIEAPTGLHVSGSGGHRLTDAAGKGHYIPAGWIHLHWQPKDGRPVFVR